MEEMGLGVQIGSFGRSKGYPAELKFGMFEIEDQPDLDACRAEIVEHTAHFVIGDSVNGFGIDDDLAENNEVRNVFPDFDLAVVNGEASLLGKRNPLKPKFNCERLLVRLFMKAMTQRIMNGKRATNDKLGLFDMNPISSICVHPVDLWLEFFKPARARRVGGGGR